MVEALDGVQWQLPLTVEQQNEIAPSQLAALIIAILLRNDRMTPQERAYRVSYYPYQLSAIRGFEIVGHARPETPAFARKWNEAVAILQAKAWIMLDPTQGNRADFMMPTSIAASAPTGSQTNLGLR